MCIRDSYCNAEHIAKIKCLKKWQSLVLGIVLVGISIYLAYGLTGIPVEWLSLIHI